MPTTEPKTDLAKTVRSTGEALRAAPEASAGSIEAQAFGPCHIVRLEDGTTLLACKTEVLAALGVNLATELSETTAPATDAPDANAVS